MKDFALGFILSTLLVSSFFAWCPYGRNLIVEQKTPPVKTVECQIRIFVDQQGKNQPTPVEDLIFGNE